MEHKLKEKIARFQYERYCIAKGWHDKWEDETEEVHDKYYSEADQIHAYYKEDGYVKLDKDQSLPKELVSCGFSCEKLLKGWRKVEIE